MACYGCSIKCLCISKNKEKRKNVSAFFGNNIYYTCCNMYSFDGWLLLILKERFQYLESLQINSQFVEKVFSYKTKSFEQTFLLACLWCKSLRFLLCMPLALGRAFGRRPQTAKYPIGGAFTRGELKNSPVGCFSRGDALQEKASPYFGSTQVCLPI